MKPYKDITNQKFGLLTAINVAGKNKQGYQWLCRCECGNEVVVNGANLRAGKSKSCGCSRFEVHKNMIIDLTGKRFGRLTVIEMAEIDNHKVKWRCRCDCGNEKIVISQSLRNGLTKSCGCLSSELFSQRYFKSLVGQKFGKLTVLERVNNIGEGDVLYKCRCDCGNIKNIAGKSLKRKESPTISCGCYRKEHFRNLNIVDITGKRYGKLVAIECVGIKDHKCLWRCKCDCGNECVLATSVLQSGNTESCGCLQSKSENRIEIFLKDNNIIYQKQKKFIKCNDIGQLPFDFYLPDYNIAIEYDGEFHYMKIGKLDNDFEGQQRRDAIKTKYCEENDIILLRIPYWEKANIESILTDWLFLDTDERNEDDEDLRKTAGCKV